MSSHTRQSRFIIPLQCEAAKKCYSLQCIDQDYRSFQKNPTVDHFLSGFGVQFTVVTPCVKKERLKFPLRCIFMFYRKIASDWENLKKEIPLGCESLHILSWEKSNSNFTKHCLTQGWTTRNALRPVGCCLLNHR